jgi:hypothetical protein
MYCRMDCAAVWQRENRLFLSCYSELKLQLPPRLENPNRPAMDGT